MKYTKPSVILLAMLLAAMAMVPCISAAEYPGYGTPGSHNVTIPGDSINLFDEFCLQKPAGLADAVPFRTYAESRESADRILAAVEKPVGTESVIGVYDLGTRQILLISQKDEILAAVYDGKTVRISTLVPELLGEIRKSGSKDVTGTGGPVGNDRITREISTRLYSVTVPAEDIVLTSYLVKKSRTDVYRTGAMDIASLHTEGWFYVNYGSSITAIGDYSSYWVTSVPFWQACQYSTQNLGAGSTAGQHKTHLKFGAPYVRYTMDMWVSCDAWLNTNDGGFTNSWYTGNSDACS